MFTSLSPSPFLGKLKHRKAAGSATAFHYSYHFRLWIKVELYRGSAATRLWLCQASHMPGPQSSPNCAWSSSILGPNTAPTEPGSPPSWAPRLYLCLGPLPSGPTPGLNCARPPPDWAPRPRLCWATLRHRPCLKPRPLWTAVLFACFVFFSLLPLISLFSPQMHSDPRDGVR